MGKKYRELKKSLKANPVRDLILVDDRAIRMSHYNHVNKTLKKIEKLEKDILRFESVDQKHFQDWLNLTFNSTLKEHQTILDEYRKIAQLHNQVRAESEMTNTSMFDAFRMIDYENSIYETATPETKSQIDKKRQKRIEFSDEAIRRESAQFDEDPFFDDEEENYDNSDASSPPKLDEMISLDHLSKDERKFYHKLLKMSPNELSEALSNKKLQKDFIVSAISVAFESKDTRLFVRLWDATPKQLQKYAEKEFDKFDVPLLDIVEAFHAAVAFEDSMSECFSDNTHPKSRNTHRDQDHNDNFDEDDSPEPGFENFPGQGKSHGQNKALTTEQELHMKSLYRKLVRWLHPDANVQPDDHQHWQKAIWYELQQCYQNKDLVGLEQIYWVTNLRSQNLSALTIDEIKKGCEVFSKKLDSIDAKIRFLKKDPAWGFSIKNDHTKLKQKIAKDLSAQIAPTQERIQELREYHAFLKHARPRPKSRRRRR